MKSRSSLFSKTFVLLLALFVSRGVRGAGEATIYRDEFGIPHVYAPTLETAAFAVGF